MNITNLVEYAGVSVATMLCALTLSACGSNDDASAIGISTYQISAVPPAKGLGSQWMEPGSTKVIEELDLVLAEPQESERNFFDGVGMFGECVLTVKKNIGVDSYEVALVRNDNTESYGQIPDANSEQDTSALLSVYSEECLLS